MLVVLNLGSLTLLAVGCTPSHAQSTFDTLGPVAREQAALFYVLFWVGLFVFVAVAGAIIYAAIRYRRKPGQGDPEQIHGHKRLEIAWTIAPTLLLAVVAVPSIAAIFNTANSPDPADEGGLVIEAVGHQWWFEFRYPDSGVVTANEMHIPVGEAINLELDSIDVIHSFWIPKLAGKVDMVPNNDNTMWLEADFEGEYLGQCAEFCGESHANMRFRVVAESQERFDAWLEEQAAPHMEPTDPLAIEGRDIFVSVAAGCRGCHTVDPIARGRKGPDLTHFASRTHLAAGILENTQENLRRWLEDPCEVKPGNLMCKDAIIYNDPDRALTEPEISALIAFLRSLE